MPTTRSPDILINLMLCSILRHNSPAATARELVSHDGDHFLDQTMSHTSPTSPVRAHVESAVAMDLTGLLP
jgi:hypothetical protein